ncbi:MAG: HAMP domain-containing histidine kinase [Bacteroidetes bacterium]|nr:HAMP domain-containing histidine kinase [Bacteroidota bacterium]MBU1720807.1 HAMP domain-containing histidine kinase [Bacteroidota bacterium]
MNIRTKLSIQFTLIVATLLAVFSISVYYFSGVYRKNDFYDRLQSRAKTTAKLLLDVEEVDAALMKIIDQNSFMLFSERVIIYAENGNLKYCSDEFFDPGIKIPPKLVREIKGNGLLEFEEGKRECVGVLYESNGNNFILFASAFDKFGLAKLNNLKWVLIIGFFIALPVTILSSLFYTKRALNPIKKIVSQADSISGSNLSLRLEEGKGKDELAQLAATFNKMLTRIETAFAMQKSFVSNASHELRTPLTAISGEIEVCLRKSRENEEYQKTLSSIQEEIHDLSHLTNGLLTLSSTSGDFFHGPVTKIRIDELIITIREEMLRINPSFIVLINFENEPESETDMSIMGNDPLLRIAFSNIVDNACKYSPNRQVKIIIRFSKGRINITFSDEGIGISPADIHRIFDPFYRSNSVSGISGHGIGLSLVRNIIRLHSGEINVRSEPEIGTSVIVIFPSIS